VFQLIPFCLHAVTTTPAVIDGVRSLVPSTDFSLPRLSGGSAPASAVSGPARCLLHVTACMTRRVA